MRLDLTRGFHISEIESKDKPAYVEHLKEKQIYDQTLNIPYPYSATDADDWLAYLEQEKISRGQAANWAIRRTDGHLIGGIGLHEWTANQSHRSEIGYWLAKPYWNQGIATEAVKAITDFAATELGLLRITAHVFHFNTASARVLEKANYQCEGVLRKHYSKDGKVFDGKLYAWVADPDN